MTKCNKNWDHANAVGFGSELDDITELFIDDIMKLTANGKFVIFQRLPGLIVNVVVVNAIDGWQSLRPLEPTDVDCDTSETYHCYWNEGLYVIYDGVELYRFALDDSDTDKILIWWDHDLGDVVVDMMGDNIGCAGDHPDFLPIETICDGVYFYWIT